VLMGKMALAALLAIDQWQAMFAHMERWNRVSLRLLIVVQRRTGAASVLAYCMSSEVAVVVYG